MALPQQRPRNRSRSLTASAMRYGTGVETEYVKRLSMTWQRRALEYIDLVPELNYASRFYARMLKQLIIFPAFLDEQGKAKRITEGEPVAALDRIQDPAGGRSQILANYGRLMFSTGEGILFGRNLDTDDEQWSFVWNDELEIDTDGRGGVKKILHYPFGKGASPREYGPSQAVAIRMWVSHPRRSGEADSPMRAALDIAEELIILTKSVRATAVSRLTKGLLVFPSEITPPPAEPVGDEDPLNDPFISDFAEHLTQQVEHFGDASATAPYVMWGAAEYLDKIRHIKLHDPASDYMERDLRREAVDRLARGFDFPPEVLLGLSESNHWAARQILDDMWRSHGAPIAEQFCDDLNESYLKPTLRRDGYEDWQRVVIGYDESQVVVQPDRSDDADKAWDRGQIGRKGYRVFKNIPDEFEPTDEEKREWLALKLRNPQLIGLQQPQSDPSDGPPPPGPEGDSGRQTRVVASAMELGAAEHAVARCRELAGIRVLRKVEECPDCAKRVNGHPNAMVASAVGAQDLKGLGLDPIGLVRGGADTLVPLLAGWGYSETQASAVAEQVEAFAARTLLEARQPMLPAGFATYLERAREASNS